MGEGSTYAENDLSYSEDEKKEYSRKASEDFNLVRKGLKPKHAQYVGSYLDGGSAYYEGKGYTLVVVATIAGTETEEGYIYGPILSLNFTPEPPSQKVLFQLSFYTHKQYRDHVLNNYK